MLLQDYHDAGQRLVARLGRPVALVLVGPHHEGRVGEFCRGGRDVGGAVGVAGDRGVTSLTVHDPLIVVLVLDGLSDCAVTVPL